MANEGKLRRQERIKQRRLKRSIEKGVNFEGESQYSPPPVEKRGFMYYLSHPEEAAKKMFPFIDVDAMMQSNKERYEALGVDPEMGKNLMRAALNPVAFGTAGVGAGALKGLFSGARKLRDINYLRKSKKLISKELLSPQSFNRYKQSHLDEINSKLKELRGFPVDNKTVAKSIKFLKESRAHANDPTSNFKDFYFKVVKDRIKNIPVGFSQSSDKYSGAYQGYAGLERGSKLRPFQFGKTRDYATPGYSTELPVNELGRMWYKDLTKQARKGGIDLVRDQIYGQKIFSGTGVHEIKHSIQQILKAYIHTAEKLIPTTKLAGQKMSKIVAEGKLKDFAGIKLPEHLRKGWKNWSEYNKYISKPWEISARFSEWRLLPSSYRKKILSGLIKKKGKYIQRNKNVSAEELPSSFYDLMQVYKTKAKFLKAEKTVWGVSAIPSKSFLDYTRKE